MKRLSKLTEQLTSESDGLSMSNVPLSGHKDHLSSLQLKDDELLFSSESVNEGHPDKLCDIVSDSVLDACFAQDPDSYVACESAAKTGMVMIFGEITTKAKLDYDKVVRDAIKKLDMTIKQKDLIIKLAMSLWPLKPNHLILHKVSIRIVVKKTLEPETKVLCLAMLPMKPKK